MEKYKKSAVVILVNSKKQILLHLRDNKPGILAPGHWAFIGGVEEKESELEAIRREVKEEINILIENFFYLDKIYFKSYNLMVSVYMGRLDIPGEEIKVNEGQGVKFFYPDEIKKIKMSKILKRIITKNLNKILSIVEN